MANGRNFSSTRRRPSVPIIILIVLLHIALFYGLVRAFAPDFTAQVEDSVVEAFTVTITTPEEKLPEVPPQPDEGAQGDPGRDAVPKPTSAPEPPVVIRTPAPVPKASSTGTDTRSGATDSGAGTGAAGSGQGTGAGRGGGGRGGIVATKPVKIAGDINSAADYPTPKGGREIRQGQSVTIAMTVGVDGRASDCRVVSPSPDPDADRITCQLAVDRFRFRPATNQDGEPIPATYGWRQRWF